MTRSAVLLTPLLALFGCDPCKDVECGEHEVCDDGSGECVCADDAWEVEGECIVYDFDFRLKGHYPLDGSGASPLEGAYEAVNEGATATEDHHGSAGGAMAFDGTSAMRIEVEDVFGDPFFDPAWSVAMWIRVDGTEDDPQTFLYGSPNRPWLFYDNADAQLKVTYVSEGSGVITISSASNPIQLGSWHHIFLTGEEGSALAWYVDGEFSDSGSFIIMDDGDIVETIFGNTNGDEQGLIGAMDELRMFDRAVPADEILAYYESQL